MRVTQSQLTPGQALYVIERMLDDRRISLADVHASLQGMDQEIRTIEDRLARLRAAAGPESTPSRQSAIPRRRGRIAKRGRPTKQKVSPARELHGRYIGYLRQFTKKQRASYKGMVATDGKEATVRKMREALGK